MKVVLRENESTFRKILKIISPKYHLHIESNSFSEDDLLLEWYYQIITHMKKLKWKK